MFADLLRTIDIPRDTRDSPGALERNTIQNEWNKCRKWIAETTRQNGCPPKITQTNQLPPAFIPFLVRLLGRSFPIYTPHAVLQSFNGAVLSEVLQAYTMDCLCEKIFQASDWHGAIFGEDQHGMLAYTRELIPSGPGL